MLSRWFAKKQELSSVEPIPGLSGPREPRHSGGWSVLRKRFHAEPGLSILDVGYTSPSNINYLTGLGHSVFLADLVQDACTGDWHRDKDEDGNPVWNVNGFLEHSLNFRGRTFDEVLLWTALDYLPEPVIAPVVRHLFTAMNPGGQVLALFHTRTQSAEAVHCRFHVTDSDDVEMQLARPFPLLRSFTTRSIEQLFADWSGHKKFLAKDGLLEVIITR